MKLDPVTGPMSREELRACVEAPHGGAAKIIRKHDPLFGLQPGEKIEWEVQCSGITHGTAYVKAASQEEADRLAADLTSGDVDWEFGMDDFDVDDIKPAKR
jgi:hypothetical protein